MTALKDVRPVTLVTSLLAALTTWVTLFAWMPFAEMPGGYMSPLLGACILVAVVGILLRSARLSAPLVLLGQVVVLFLWLQHRLASDVAIAGLVPTADSLRAMVEAVHTAAVVSQSYAAPVPVSAPQFYPLLIVAGSATALMVDFLAVGIRRAPLAGLPLLAAYTAPVSILDGGVSWVKFAAAAVCFLFLIAGGEEERLTAWGHRLTTGPSAIEVARGAAPTHVVWSSARKIGFTATALAVVVPALVPTFSAGFLGGGGGGHGNGDAVSISNPMVDLKRDLVRGADVDAVEVTTTEPDPSYLRISVLDSFDGNAWRPSGRDIPSKQRADGTLPKPPGLLPGIASRTYTAHLKVSDTFRSRWLPTPYPTTSLNAPGDWRYDRSTMDFISAVEGQTTAGLSYRLRSEVLSPTAAQLADATPAPLSVYTPGTALPAHIPAYVRNLARSVTADKLTRFEQAVALQEFFRVDGGFRYSLEPSPGNGTNDLLRFLGTGKGSRVGYCEQFAAAMALMGRTLGIPSRVAVGFLRPDRVGQDTYVYSTHDLHAWPEMYFGGVGWVRFEPTPAARTGGDLPAYTTQQLPRTPTASASGLPSAVPSANRQDRTAQAQATADQQSGGTSSTSRVLLTAAGGALLAVLLLLTPRTLRSLVRRRRWAAARDPAGWVEAAWREIHDTATDLSIPWDDRVTLRSAAQQLAVCFGRADDADPGRARRGPAADPAATAALHRLTGLLERARYARELPEGSTTPDAVMADVAACVAAMRAGARRRRQLVATWAPRSLLSRLPAGRRTGGGGPTSGVGGVDRTVASSPR